MLKAMVRVFFQAATQESPDVRRRFLWQSLPIGLAFDNTCYGIGDCTALEWAFTCEHLIQETAERPNIRATINGTAPDLFRRHIRRRTDHTVRLCFGNVAALAFAGRDFRYRSRSNQFDRFEPV